ncbi:MAG: 2-C-methyl-D-erythritol 4-phosphate cytidylyltransferase [Gemmatimonadales bacterium]
MTAAPDAGAVIVAAGRGVRASEGGAEPKQYRPVAGVRVLLRAIRPFAQHPRVGPIVVVLPPEDAAKPPEWLAPLLSDRLRVAAGGEMRRQSVANGLAVLGEASLVLVHDAARPFVETDLIDRVLAVAALGACAVPGLPLADTLKETDTAGLVVRTVPRERLVAVQTPQGFPRAMLETAHQRSRNDPALANATDDAALCERLGYPVRVVAGSPRNFKITTAADFVLAEALAAGDGARP